MPKQFRQDLCDDAVAAYKQWQAAKIPLASLAAKLKDLNPDELWAVSIQTRASTTTLSRLRS